MKLHIVESYDEMSKIGSDIIISLVQKNPGAILGLATGSTPTGVYKELIKDHQLNRTSYSGVQTFNLDEYVGLDGSHPQSYRYFMNEKLFNHIDIDIEKTNVPHGKTENLNEECLRYENMVKASGGIDIQLLGIGRNGHIGFNEPGTSFESNTHIVTLAESTLQANSRFFDSIDSVPTHAITMGIQSILRSKQILLLASGESKRGAMKQLLMGDMTEDFPASALQSHPNVLIIADKLALQDVDLDKIDAEIVSR